KRDYRCRARSPARSTWRDLPRCEDREETPWRGDYRLYCATARRCRTVRAAKATSRSVIMLPWKVGRIADGAGASGDLGLSSGIAESFSLLERAEHSLIRVIQTSPRHYSRVMPP